MMIEAVVDLSHWNSSVDFSEMKKGGILGVILKATQGGSYIDPTFVRRAMEAHAVDLLVGAYHFADASDPLRQAMHFLAVAGCVAPLLAIDIEPNGTSGGTVSIKQAATLVSCLQGCRSRLPLAYIGRYGPDGSARDLPNSILARCPLWLPAYGPRAICPLGWTEWGLWQFTDGAEVRGVSGKCDLNRFLGSADDLETWWGAL